MRKFPAIVPLIFFAAIFPLIAFTQEPLAWDVRALSQIIPGAPVGDFFYDTATGLTQGTNGIFVQYGGTV